MNPITIYLKKVLFVLFCVIFALPLLVSAQKKENLHENDTLVNILISWKLDENFQPDSIVLDTSMAVFQVFREADKHSISSSELGNAGAANMSNLFFKRKDNYTTNFLFNRPYYLYTITPEKITYFNTRKPYTNIFYSTASKIKDEQVLDFLHTQNISPKWNVGALYNLIISKGQYPNQQIKNNSMGFWAAFTSDKYSVHAAITNNKFKHDHNGGIIDTGTVDINSIEVNLSNAGTILLNRDFFIAQEYKFGQKKAYTYKNKEKDTVIYRTNALFAIGHVLNLHKSYRIYQDKESAENGFYTNFYHEKQQSFDSVYYHSINNQISIITKEAFLQKYHTFAAFSVKNDFKKYYNFKEYMLLNSEKFFIENSLSSNIIYHPTPKIQLYFSGNLFLSGYRKNDKRFVFETKKYFADSTAKYPVLELKVDYTQQNPHFFEQSYYSNHFRWNNNFAPTTTIHAELKFNWDKYNLSVGADAAQINNYIYYGSLATPQQFDSIFQVFSAYIQKDFHLGSWHTHNKVVWQKSSNQDIISLPEMALYHASYFELKYKKALRAHVGFDIYYSLPFRIYSFNPAVGQFYFENILIGDRHKFTGDYAFGSAFINMQLKRNVTMFFKMEHVLSGVFKQIYYSVNNYPVSNRIFKFGIRWTFNN